MSSVCHGIFGNLSKTFWEYFKRCDTPWWLQAHVEVNGIHFENLLWVFESMMFLTLLHNLTAFSKCVIIYFRSERFSDICLYGLFSLFRVRNWPPKVIKIVLLKNRIYGIYSQRNRLQYGLIQLRIRITGEPLNLRVS